MLKQVAYAHIERFALSTLYGHTVRISMFKITSPYFFINVQKYLARFCFVCTVRNPNRLDVLSHGAQSTEA